MEEIRHRFLRSGTDGGYGAVGVCLVDTSSDLKILRVMGCAMFADPLAMNVAGLDALRELQKDSERVPLKCMITPGSCVPAVPGFEDTGSKIDTDDIRETMRPPLLQETLCHITAPQSWTSCFINMCIRCTVC